MERYEALTLDEERALYGLNGAEVVRCVFEGPADGESALKECRDVHLDDCDLRLRYPLWHVSGGSLTNCRMTETCRAALWYDDHLTINGCEMNGIKALRECRDITINGGSALAISGFAANAISCIFSNFSSSSPVTRLWRSRAIASSF